MTYQLKCDSHNGLQEVSGSISFDDNNLNFEYQANPLGLIKASFFFLLQPLICFSL